MVILHKQCILRHEEIVRITEVERYRRERNGQKMTPMRGMVYVETRKMDEDLRKAKITNWGSRCMDKMGD